MGNDVNQVMLVGRLTRSGELRYTTGGSPILTFSLANGYQIKKGENWEDAVSFFNCQLWGKRAEALAPYLRKGKQIAITGQLRQERWTKDGETRSRVIINVSSLQLLGKKEEGISQEQNINNHDAPDALPQFDDDIPF